MWKKKIRRRNRDQAASHKLQPVVHHRTLLPKAYFTSSAKQGEVSPMCFGTMLPRLKPLKTREEAVNVDDWGFPQFLLTLTLEIVET